MINNLETIIKENGRENSKSISRRITAIKLRHCDLATEHETSWLSEFSIEIRETDKLELKWEWEGLG